MMMIIIIMIICCISVFKWWDFRQWSHLISSHLAHVSRLSVFSYRTYFKISGAFIIKPAKCKQTELRGDTETRSSHVNANFMNISAWLVKLVEIIFTFLAVNGLYITYLSMQGISDGAETPWNAEQQQKKKRYKKKKKVDIIGFSVTWLLAVIDQVMLSVILWRKKKSKKWVIVLISAGDRNNEKNQLTHPFSSWHHITYGNSANPIMQHSPSE